jgi:hypothetical protein
MSGLPDDYDIAAWTPLAPLHPQDLETLLRGLSVQLAGFLDRGGPGDFDSLLLVLSDGSVLAIGGRHDPAMQPPSDAMTDGTVSLVFGLLQTGETSGPSLTGRQAAAYLTGCRLDDVEVAVMDDGAAKVVLFSTGDDRRLGVSVVPTVTTTEAGHRPRLDLMVALEGEVLSERRRASR